MTDKPGDLVSALHELDACKATMSAMSEEMAALRDLLQQTMNTLNQAVTALNTKEPAKRQRGRPKKIADDDSLLLNAFNGIKAEFVAANTQENPTDGAVLNWYFEKVFSQHGLRATKVKGTEFQKKLKTFRNRLSDARQPASPASPYRVAEPSDTA